ncbi:MAG: protein-tyrosine-phosphatase [Pseudomonadota bacterium]|nr:protein-tyrosine-phosphatase [Pseudomonadota bacterium]
MAAGLMRFLHGGKLFIASVGVRAAAEPDAFMVAAMDELGIDLSRHKPQSFDDLDDTSFDVVVSLSPEAHHKALELTRTMAIEAEYWPTPDPSAGMGSREQILDDYRAVRDGLLLRLRERFASVGARGV